MSETQTKKKEQSNISETLASNEEILTLIREMSEKIKKAPVLNGGFSELKNNISGLKQDVSMLKEAQTHDTIFHEKLNKDIEVLKDTQITLKDSHEELKTNLYEPENGLYTKMYRASTSQRETAAIQKKLFNSIEDVKSVIAPIVHTNEKLVLVAGGKELPALNSILKIQKMLTRIFWLGFTGLGSVTAKLLYDYISPFIW